MQREEILALAEGQREYVVATRRHFHQHPELSFKETNTAAFVAAELKALGIETRTGIGSGGTGIVATLTGGRPGPTLALRADMDALPVQEENDLPFRSVSAGAMHACGHDAHTAILLGVARALATVREQVPGRVVFLFQHAEEDPPGGAIELVEAGCLEGVDAVFGLHQSPPIDTGKIVVAPGPQAASSDTFRIDVRGRGGHGAAPHFTVDPIHIAAELVTSLHRIVSRRVDPLKPAVITVGTFQAGTKENVISDTARLTGTVRAFSQSVRELLHREIETVTRGVTDAWGATFELEYVWGYPPMTNHAGMAELGARAAERILTSESVSRTGVPIMGAEDFAHYLIHVQGAFAALGTGTAGVRVMERPRAHSAGFLMSEDALPVGMAWFLSLVMNFTELQKELGNP